MKYEKTKMKLELENFCRFWRFENDLFPKIKKYVDSYIHNVLLIEHSYCEISGIERDSLIIKLDAHKKRESDETKKDCTLKIKWEYLQKYEEIKDGKLTYWQKFFELITSDTTEERDLSKFNKWNLEDCSYHFDYKTNNPKALGYSYKLSSIERYKEIMDIDGNISKISKENCIMFSKQRDRYTSIDNIISKIIEVDELSHAIKLLNETEEQEVI